MLKKEADKLFTNILKSEIKGSQFKMSSGFLFVRKGIHFFDCISIIATKPQKVHFSLRYKWFDTDDLLWKILGMPENSKRSLSFHASAAFCAHSVEIYNHDEVVVEISEQSLRPIVQRVLFELPPRMSEIERKIGSPADYCHFLETHQREHVDRFPGSKLSVGLELVLGLILGNQFENALQITKVKIKEKVSGGYNIKGKTAFELTETYIENSLLTSTST